MENWLQAALREADTTLESVLDITPEDSSYIAEHPGMLTINEVNAVARVLPDEVARRMLERLVEVFAL